MKHNNVCDEQLETHIVCKRGKHVDEVTKWVVISFICFLLCECIVTACDVYLLKHLQHLMELGWLDMVSILPVILFQMSMDKVQPCPITRVMNLI